MNGRKIIEYQKDYWKWRWVEEDLGADHAHDAQIKLKEFKRGEDETGGQKIKCKNGQTETAGVSYASWPMWKQYKEEEEEEDNKFLMLLSTLQFHDNNNKI